MPITSNCSAAIPKRGHAAKPKGVSRGRKGQCGTRGVLEAAGVEFIDEKMVAGPESGFGAPNRREARGRASALALRRHQIRPIYAKQQ
jgi:hypothetical protein